MVGPMPSVGASVVVEVERVTGMPFKLIGRRVQVLSTIEQVLGTEDEADPPEFDTVLEEEKIQARKESSCSDDRKSDILSSNEEGTVPTSNPPRVIYNNLSCNPRSDFSFKQMMDEDHHNGESVLNDISIEPGDHVTSFPTPTIPAVIKTPPEDAEIERLAVFRSHLAHQHRTLQFNLENADRLKRGLPPLPKPKEKKPKRLERDIARSLEHNKASLLNSLKIKKPQ
ncbi:DNA mismatch repair protein MutS [Folsomia candida]|uniref:DNA mismatch repair protein MutS n=1 Tax=Folsomia candida TaxID=158441 RepID=A0A226DW33_FOLCA|nr:DNA mismatch repair protein MutS [Folsomia candida]